MFNYLVIVMDVVALELIERAKKQHELTVYVHGVLKQNYPLRRWFVSVSNDLSVVSIYLGDVSGMYGMQVHLDRINHYLGIKVKELAGEFLERFKLSRDKNASDISNLVTDFRGEHINAAAGEA